MSTGAGTLTISAPTMSGSVATYTALMTLPLVVNQTFNDTSATAQINVTGTVQASGSFQFDFGPRAINWNVASGSFPTNGYWDVGFAPRSGDTVVVANSGVSTLSTVYSGSPAAVWLGNGASSAGTLAITTGGSLTTGAMVLGHSGGSGVLVISGGTLVTTSITEGTGTGNSGLIYFDGGTLEPSANNAAFVSGLTGAFVRAGGIKINTNGHSVTVNQTFLRDPLLLAAPDGGLFKDGSGTLTLDSQNNQFTGGTTVRNGTLILTHSNAIPGGTNVTVGNPLLFTSPDAAIDELPVSAVNAPSKASDLAPTTLATAVPEPGTLVLAALLSAAADR
jgi:autotransporter-associated beta strand protein